MSSKPTPVSEAMAPAPSPPAWGWEPLFVGPSRMTTPLSWYVMAKPTLRQRCPVEESADPRRRRTAR